jgi:hypothetical protein
MFIFCATLIVFLLGAASILNTSAHANSQRTISMEDCYPEYFLDNTVYLQPEDELIITFQSCEEVELTGFLYQVGNSMVNTLDVSPSGTIVVRGNGTAVVTDSLSSQTWSGTWDDILIRFTAEVQQYNFLSIFKTNQNITEIPNSTLLGSPKFIFPTLITENDVIRSGENFDVCLNWEVDYPERNTHIFVSQTFNTNTEGVFTFRTISTTPISSFTTYLANLPNGFSSSTALAPNPLDETNLLIYSSFDPLNPSEGLLACGVRATNAGNYLETGEVLTSRSFQTEVFLEPGTYTVVSAKYKPITLATWNNINGARWWTPVENQSVNTQIWGPAQHAAQSEPALAATGTTNYAPVVVLLFAVGALLIFLTRSPEKKRL